VGSHTEILTHIPDGGTYGLTIFVIVSLGAFAMAVDIHRRWPRAIRPSVSGVYCAALLFASVWGLLVLGNDRLMPQSAPNILLSAGLGVLGGALAVKADRWIIRTCTRRSLHDPQSRSKYHSPAARIDSLIGPRSTVPIYSSMTLSERRRLSTPRQGRRTSHQDLDYRDTRVIVVIVAAALEEVVYRGLMVKLCFLFLLNLRILIPLLIGTTVLFALSHVWFGWPNVFAKWPLGAIALTITLVVGNIAPAILAHVWFNLAFWRREAGRRRQGSAGESNPYGPQSMAGRVL